MDEINLEEIITFSLGRNTTRITKDDGALYTPVDFDRDLKGKTEHLIDCQLCIINLIKSKAVPLSKTNEEKILTQNFLKCDLDASKILPWYFCYQFNEGKKFRKQINMVTQGITLNVKRLNMKMVENLTITLPDLKTQKIIGELYRRSVIQYDLQQQLARDLYKYSQEFINTLLGGN